MKKKRGRPSHSELLSDYGKDIAVLKKELKELQNLVFNMGRRLQTLWNYHENSISNSKKVDKLLKKLKKEQVNEM